MAEYTNNLRLKEIANGAESGSWGTSTNTNLDLIAEAFGYSSYDAFSSDADVSITIENSGATQDLKRSMYLKFTSTATLSTTRTITITPNTISRVLFIENATTGSQSIAISQGSGANVTIGNGKVKCVYLDGAGSGAAVVEVFDNFEVKDSLKISGTTPTLTLGDGDAEDTKIVFDGNATDYHIGLDDSSDQLVIGRGSTLGTLPGVKINTSVTSNVLTLGGTYGLEVDSADGGTIAHFYAQTAEAIIRTDTSGDNPVDFGSDTSGNFVVKTGSTPTKRFSVSDNADGDVNLHTGSLFFDTASAGIFLRSPNNTEFKITVDNSGNLVATEQ